MNPKKILVADDNAVFRKILSRQIKNSGFQTHEVASGSEALTVLQQQPDNFDLIFLDQSMPELSGMETFLEMQEVIANLPPVIMITAHDSLNLALSFIKAGGFDFLVKPIDPDIVEAKITKAIAHQALSTRVHKPKRLPQWLTQTTHHLALWHLTDTEVHVSPGLNKILHLPANQEPTISWRRVRSSLPTALQFLLANPPNSPALAKMQACKIACGDQQTRTFNLYYTSSQDPIPAWSGCLLATQEIKQKVPEYDINQLLHLLQNPAALWTGGQYTAANLRLDKNIGEETIRSQSQLETLMAAKGYQQHTLHLDDQQLWIFHQSSDPNANEPIPIFEIRDRLGLIIGKSKAMQPVYQKIIATAKDEAGILIQGESGTGKELTARTIHNLSRRSSGPFIAVNCGAIPANLFESEFFGHRKGAFTGAVQDKVGYFDLAHRGTLFLDEVGELTLENQVKLLRALDKYGYMPVGGKATVKADIRIIAATNRNLTTMMHEGSFREDLYYRINVIQMHLPPLRERQGDIPLLVNHLLANLPIGNHKKPSAKQYQALENHEWKGNIRELINVLNRFRSTGIIEFTALTGNNKATSESKIENLTQAMAAYERKLILQALNQHEWHRGNTATSLAIPERTLRRKMRNHNLN